MIIIYEDKIKWQPRQAEGVKIANPLQGYPAGMRKIN